MNVEEVVKYITDKKIPISFVWVDNIECFLRLFIDKYKIYNDGVKCYCIHDSYVNELSFFDGFIEQHKTKSIEYHLTEFLYWFELNKHRCKDIKYYENNC